MKTLEQIKKEANHLSQADKEKLESISLALLELKKRDQISIDGLKEITNLEREFWCFRENYNSKLLNLLKQGNII